MPPRYRDHVPPSAKANVIPSTMADDSNSFAFYSNEPTPSPTSTFEYTYQPTAESTPWPTYPYERRDDNDESSPLMRAYATIGFIIRIFLPIILIIMCCRMKRRRDPVLGGGGGTGGGGGGGGGRGGQDGFGNEVQQQTPEERRRFVEEHLCTKKVLEAAEGQTVPSFADDILCKSDIIVPKQRKETIADDEEVGDTWYESEEPSCSICLCPYEPGDDICWSCNTQCTHAFHQECMTEWLQRHDDCPQCRQEYLKAESEEDGDGDEEKIDGDDAGRMSSLSFAAALANDPNATTARSSASTIIRPLEVERNESARQDGDMEDIDQENGGVYIPTWISPGIGRR